MAAAAIGAAHVALVHAWLPNRDLRDLLKTVDYLGLQVFDQCASIGIGFRRSSAAEFYLFGTMQWLLIGFVWTWLILELRQRRMRSLPHRSISNAATPDPQAPPPPPPPRSR
ncbi:MAG: hypothetical protein H0W83_07360 [Planctomycetes bacterium]|nr:hypothetical protein [Planctomycetota bacterium]